MCGLLHRGEVREAAARYRGPLLPGSEAPGVVREREALESWMRQSVMSSGDQEALWSWLQTASGAQDVAAWQRLLAEPALPGPAPQPGRGPDRDPALGRAGPTRHHTARL